jgi:hypothetical protein
MSLTEMNAPAQEADFEGPSLGTGGRVTRERSTVRFPYGDLDAAIGVVRAITGYGLECSLSQLAAALQLDAGSGTFRQRVSSAQIFGLISSGRTGQASLTPLGRRMSDPAQEERARVEAFLTVPLYKIIFDRFDGTVLPGDAGLEAEMVRAGVAQKQVTKARQAFARSAAQANMFSQGRGRLVVPASVTVVTEKQADPPPPGDMAEKPSGGAAGGQAEGGALTDPMIVGLFDRLVPEEGKPFSAYQRTRFLRALVNVLDVIYGEPDDGSFDADGMTKLYKIHGSSDVSKMSARQTEASDTPRSDV